MLKKLTEKYWYKPVKDYLKTTLWVSPLVLFPLAGGATLLLKDITDLNTLLNSPLEVVIGTLLGIWAIIVTREILYKDVKQLIRDIKWEKYERDKDKNSNLTIKGGDLIVNRGYTISSDPLKCAELKFDGDEKSI